MRRISIWLVALVSMALLPSSKIVPAHNFRIRTITAGITLASLSDTIQIKNTIQFLKETRQKLIFAGYEVQTIRIATQHFHQYPSVEEHSEAMEFLKVLDRIAVEENVSVSIGELLSGNQYKPEIAGWAVQLTTETSNISFSLPISSEELGIHHNTIRSAAEVCKALAQNSPGGEANFRFTASANCPPETPFFPAAFHQGERSFAIGLETPNLLKEVFVHSNWGNAQANLMERLESELLPIQNLAEKVAHETGWKYQGIDSSPAPGLDASIGEAIETLTGKPFGSPSTLSACAIITSALKGLNIKLCGYSGLMLPVIEDKVLAKRAAEGKYTVEELLLFSAVSGTGLDVVPLPGNTELEDLEAAYRDAASLSLKYSNKALSVRLFPLPGKEAGEFVEFDNPYLTGSVVMSLH